MAKKAKKKPATKTRTKGTAPVAGRRQTRTQIERVLGDGPLRRQPRNAPLPGMDGIRIEALDAICADIGDQRETISAAKASELDLESQALHLLLKYGKDSWSAAGVAISRKVIEEKSTRVLLGGAWIKRCDCASRDRAVPDHQAAQGTSGAADIKGDGVAPRSQDTSCPSGATQTTRRTVTKDTVMNRCRSVTVDGNEGLFDRSPFTIEGFRFRGRTVEPVGRPKITQWQAAFRFACESEEASPWWVAALLCYAEDRAEWQATLDQAMTVTRLSRQRLLNLASLYRRSTEETRALAPSPAHLDVVAKLPPAEQCAWLDRARREEMRERDLRAAVRAASRRTVIEGQAVLPTRAFEVEVTVALTVEAETSYAASERGESEVKACLDEHGSKARVLFARVVSE